MLTEAYFNLHKQLFSLRQNSRVVNHVGYAHLLDVNFVVRPAGRAKVLQTQRKNVHAFVKGRLMATSHVNRWPALTNWREASYNPYKAGYFFVKDTGEKIEQADFVCLQLGLSGKPQIWVADKR